MRESGAGTGAGERGEGTRLKGRLPQVYFPALLSGETDQLVHRLGDKGTVDDPMFGRSTGQASLVLTLARAGKWLTERNASFETGPLLTGTDHDVVEGIVALQSGQGHIRLPVAVVAEKRREREVELRLYYSLKALKATLGGGEGRKALIHSERDVSAPVAVDSLLDALARADLDGILATLESTATVRSGDGTLYRRSEDAGAFRAHLSRLVAAGSSPAGTRLLKNARADDGRTCAIEYTANRLGGRDIAPQAGLAIFQRGDSGLLQSVRFYDDVG